MRLHVFKFPKDAYFIMGSNGIENALYLPVCDDEAYRVEYLLITSPRKRNKAVAGNFRSLRGWGSAVPFFIFHISIYPHYSCDLSVTSYPPRILSQRPQMGSWSCF